MFLKISLLPILLAVATGDVQDCQKTEPGQSCSEDDQENRRTLLQHRAELSAATQLKTADGHLQEEEEASEQFLPKWKKRPEFTSALKELKGQKSGKYAETADKMQKISGDYADLAQDIEDIAKDDDTPMIYQKGVREERTQKWKKKGNSDFVNILAATEDQSEEGYEMFKKEASDFAQNFEAFSKYLKELGEKKKKIEEKLKAIYEGMIKKWASSTDLVASLKQIQGQDSKAMGELDKTYTKKLDGLNKKVKDLFGDKVSKWKKAKNTVNVAYLTAIQSFTSKQLGALADTFKKSADVYVELVSDLKTTAKETDPSEFQRVGNEMIDKWEKSKHPKDIKAIANAAFTTGDVTQNAKDISAKAKAISEFVLDLKAISEEVEKSESMDSFLTDLKAISKIVAQDENFPE